MTQTEQEAAPPQHAGWDALVALVLGAALLAAGWLDVGSYLTHLYDPPPPSFAFLAPNGSEHPGDGERYRLADGSSATLENIGDLEIYPHRRLRHTYGPRSELVLYTHCAHARLHFQLDNPVADQDLTVSCNGQTVEPFTRLPVGVVARDYSLALRPGVNEVVWTFARYNHGGADVAPADPRPISGTFLAFDLTLD